MQITQIGTWLSELPNLTGLAPLSILKPSINSITETLQRGQRLGFNHQYAGSTQNAPPLPSTAFAHKPRNLCLDWRVDHVRKQIGHGRHSYDRAVKAVMQWKQMDLGWTTVQADSPIKGSLVCVLPHVAAVWMRLPLQVVFVNEGRSKTVFKRMLARARHCRPLTFAGRRVEIAHSTLQGHALAGEERFALEWNKTDDSVWYDLYTVSKPATPVAVLSYPVIRFLQKRFQRDTFSAMEQAIK